MNADLRTGSKHDLTAPKSDFCYFPGSGHCPPAETRKIVLRVKSNFLNGIKLILPSSPISENISLYNSDNRKYNHRRPPHRGALRNVTNAGLDAMDAGSATDESAFLRTAKSCGPDASRSASSRWSYLPMTVSTNPDHRGEHEISRKPLRGECRVFPV